MKRIHVALLFLISASISLLSAAQPPMPLPSDAHTEGRDLGGISGIVIPGDTNPIAYAEAIDSNHSLTAPRLLVGIPDKAPGGEAEILSWNGTTWSPVYAPAMPIPVTNARFGASVAMYGMEGFDAVAVVGAPDHNDDAGTEVGAAFVYRHVGGNWQLETVLKPPATGDVHNFGTSVEVVGEGDFATIIVSSPHVAHNSFTDVGAVYIYNWNSGSSDYELTQTLYAGATQNNERMGGALGADSNNNKRLIAASAKMPDGSGRVYVFYFDGSVWTLDETIDSPNSQGGYDFGADLDLEWWIDDVILVIGEPYGTTNSVAGSGAAYVYNGDRVTTNWTLDEQLDYMEPIAGGRFGESVALSRMYADPIIMVGEPGFDVTLPMPITDAGRVTIYRDIGYWWGRNQSYTNDPHTGFGASVEIVGHAQNGWLFIGAPTAFNADPPSGVPGPGGLYFYDLVADPPVPDGTTWVTNGSFETAGTSAYLPDGWILKKRLPGDMRTCGTVAGSGGVPGDKAYDGLCAFKFRGNTGKKAVLIFAITKPDLETLIGQPITTSDRLELTLFYKMKPTNKPLVRLIGWRAPGNITKFYHKLQTKPAGDVYGDWHYLEVDVDVTNTNFVELRLVIKDKSSLTNAILWVDSVDARYIPFTGGGRGRNDTANTDSTSSFNPPDTFRAP